MSAPIYYVSESLVFETLSLKVLKTLFLVPFSNTSHIPLDDLPENIFSLAGHIVGVNEANWQT